jgi:hypothetical protein
MGKGYYFFGGGGGDSKVVVTACSACDFQVWKLQPIKLSTICIRKQRLGRNLTRVFLMFWGVFRVWKWAVIRTFRSNRPQPVVSINYKCCRARHSCPHA